MKDWVLAITALVFAIAMFIAVGYTRVVNPDMAETRLFITYWPLYTTLMAGAVLFGVLLKFGHKK